MNRLLDMLAHIIIGLAMASVAIILVGSLVAAWPITLFAIFVYLVVWATERLNL